jgi:hypothetical protein
MSRTNTLFVLATVASLFTVSTGARADEPTESDAPPAKVTVRTDASEVTIGYVTHRAAAVASNGTSAMAVAWKDVCIAPCEFKLPSGLHELVATGPGYVGGTEKVQLSPGDNHFVVKPGSSAMRWGGWGLAIVGLSVLTLGVASAAVGSDSVDSKGNMTHSTPGWALPLAIAGGLAAGGGITMIVMSSTSIQRESGGNTGRSVFVGAGYSGRF